MSAMSLRSLCNAARALYPAAEVRFRSVPEKEGVWRCLISVGSAIIIESSEGSLEAVLYDTSQRIKNISVTMKSYLDEDEVVMPDSFPKTTP